MDILQYYSEPGINTDLKRHAERIDSLPNQPGLICQVAQGLIVHDMWVAQYGVEKPEAHDFRVNMAEFLDRVLLKDDRPLAIPRTPERRAIACCREFATLACAFLRAKGIPARSRCGFAAYFNWGGLEDHWMVEYWNGERWVRNDPQLDPLQYAQLEEWNGSKFRAFDPRDLSAADFITGGDAYLQCLDGRIDPETCGIANIHGLWFVRGQLLRDFAALNKIEVEPQLVRGMAGWADWPLIAKTDEEITPEEAELLRHAAALTLEPDENLRAIRELYECESALQAPPSILEDVHGLE